MLAAPAPPPALMKPAALHAKAPSLYNVAFTTTKGRFVVTVHRSWAPRGADRFYNLVRARFFDGVEFFRVVKGFVVQFGISPYPAVSRAWQNATIPDDPVKARNTPATITFADAGPSTRTTQIFINLGSNTSLDTQGFARPRHVWVERRRQALQRVRRGADERAAADRRAGERLPEEALPEARLDPHGPHR
jgi:cyclophilin family peptidyl-prolyl cis-trans isomerase